MKRFGLLLFIFLGWVLCAQAVEYRRFGQDHRTLAMGNTGIVTANSSAALFYNPAAMGNIFNWWVDLPVTMLTYSDDTKNLITAAQDGSFNLNSQEEQIAFMQDFVGKNPYVKFDLGANALINLKGGWTVGGNYTYEAVLDLEVRNPTMPVIDLYAKLDHIRQTGFSFPLGSGKWLFGVTAKRVERTEIAASYSVADALNEVPFPTMASAGVNGKGLGYDVGMIYRQASKSRMMWGLVYRQEIDLGDAGKIPSEVAAGVAMIQELGFLRWTTAMDFRDLTYQQGSLGDKSLNRRTHLGTEIGLVPLSKNSSLIYLRAGYAQGWASTGAELALGHSLVLGYTKYTEERGEYAGQKGSPRTILYFSSGF